MAPSHCVFSCFVVANLVEQLLCFRWNMCDIFLKYLRYVANDLYKFLIEMFQTCYVFSGYLLANQKPTCI